MSMAPSVEKIGGTSIAATDAVVDNVLIAGRAGRDLYQRIFVVSAYGGITDLLLEPKKKTDAAKPPGLYASFAADGEKGDWRDALDAVAAAMRARNE
ncbi:MAG: aspartate kinase, partial [Acidiphilium sp.]